MNRYNNYHKHDHVSNIFTPDCNVKAEDYIKKSLEYGHTNYFTTNHGSFGDIFEARTLCDKYGLKCIAGIEGYIVPDATEKDKRNYHIVVIPKTDEARKRMNYVSSNANINGYYYKPRFFMSDLLALPDDDIYITSACCAGLLRDEDSINQILLPLIDKFGKNVLLEVQTHLDEKQKEINLRAIQMKEKFGLSLIAANDSHYIDAAGQTERLELLKGKKITYDDEDSFILDFPDYDTMVNRFRQQAVLTEEQIQEAMDSTLLFDECEEIQLDHSIKMPTIYPDLTPAERVAELKKEVNRRFKEIRKTDGITDEEFPKYKEGIRYEMKIIEDTNEEIHTADYFLFNTKNVELAVNKYGGVLTRGGRGSCASFYINRILGMTQLDRFRIKLPIFPDRFASTARLLENRALPDIDYNVKEQGSFVAASRELLGEHGCYPMYAPGTMQLSEAFRNVCRSKGMPFEDFNDVAKDIENHLDDKDWAPILEEANKYVGTIISGSVHPCFAKNEIVDTKTGYKYIQNINIGDEVLADDNKFHKVTNTFVTNNADTYLLKIAGRPNVVVTPNHPFLVRHMTHDSYRKRLFDNEKWVTVEDMQNDDFVCININTNSIIPYFEQIPTENKYFWWLIGRYLGDGWLKKIYPNRRERVITICCAYDKIEEVSSVLTKLNYYNFWGERCRTVYKFHIANKYLYEFLIQFGIGAKNKKVPKFVQDMPIELIQSFVEGYISADGYVAPDKAHTTMATTISKELAFTMSNCINKAYATYCSISETHRKDTYLEGRLIKGNTQYVITYRLNPRRPSYYIDKDKIWVRYRSKELYQNSTVYNIEVEDAHTYTVSDIVVHNCAHLLSNNNILYEYGVTRLGENLCVLITSAEADEYKVLKNDYLIVTVWKLIDETFKEVGKPIIPAPQLLEEIKDDPRIWALFSHGITCTLNQVDSDNGTNQAKRYGIKSFEDGAFIAAAIRPSFDAWRDRFLNHEPYSTGSTDLDRVLSMTNHYILYQENLMQYFEWLGVTPSESIGLIKKISKKKIKPEDFLQLEERIKKQWIINTGSEDKFQETWEMIQGCMAYGFASPHAAATSADMCYGAYLKVHYPLEYYTVCFNNYADDEVRTRKLTKELDYFGIKLGGIEYGHSRSNYSYDHATNTIYKGLRSIKFISEKCAEDLYELSQHEYDTFVDLLIAMQNSSVDSRQLDILIRLNYFKPFGNSAKLQKIVEMFNTLNGKKQLKLDKLAELGIPEYIVTKCAKKITAKIAKDFDWQELLNEWVAATEFPKSTLIDYIRAEHDLLGYIQTTAPNAGSNLYYITDDKGDSSRMLTLYQIKTGDTKTVKCRKKVWWPNPIHVGSVIKVLDIHEEKKWGKDANGEWIRKEETEPILGEYVVMEI